MEKIQMKMDVDELVFKKLNSSSVSMLPTEIAGKLKNVTRQAVTGALLRLKSRGRVRKLEDNTWEPTTPETKAEETLPKAKVVDTKAVGGSIESQILVVEESVKGKINGGLLWDTYYALRGDESDAVIKSVLSDSAYELLGSITGMFTPGEAITLLKGMAIGIALMKED